MSNTTDRPTRAERKDAAREKARRLREEVEARRRRTRRLAVSGAAVGVLAVVVAVGAVVQAGRSAVTDGSAAPANVVDGGVVAAGAPDAPELAVYLDYACPACAQFEAQDGEWLRSLAADGEISLVYKPISILDRYSTTRFSTRAASAAGCVAETSPEAFGDFTAAMLARQAPESGPGLSNEQIWSVAESVGVDAAAEQCVLDERFTDWAAATTDAASRAGVQGTPTVSVNGELLTDRSRASIGAAVEAAG
ncbi:MAG: DsbA family protein [Actinomycetes bacterium]